MTIAEDRDQGMGKPRQPKLKVFQAQIGFFDTVVAASSQAAALRAWGVHQNLFASGDARVTEDERAITAALANPETPLRRAVGSSDPFDLEPASLPKVPDGPKRHNVKQAASARGKPPLPKPPADRSALDAAEAFLGQLDELRKREEADLRQRQDMLDAAKAEAQSTYTQRRKGAVATIAAARKAYREAGGKD